MSTTERSETAANQASSGHTPSLADVRSVDRELLLCLRSGDSKSIGELTDMLGVTATAVRQRVERLLELRLIDRQKVVAGRGRPTYRYLLTVAGYRRAGADAADLAEAMWHEILQFPDREIREQLVTAVARRLGQQYAAEMDPSADTAPFAQRMRQLTTMLRAREIPAAVHQQGDLPVLDIEACPYPNLTDVSDDRAMCRLEEQMLSEALGEDVHLNRCRLDGDTSCQFVTSSSATGLSESQTTISTPCSHGNHSENPGKSPTDHSN